METGSSGVSCADGWHHDYVYGAGSCTGEYSKRFVEVPDGKKNGSSRSVNLLGVTPLDFGPRKMLNY